MDKQIISDFWKKRKWKNFRKSDWAVLGLLGVLLMVLAMPLETKEDEIFFDNDQMTAADVTNVQTANTGSKMSGYEEQDMYVKQLEEKLEGILEKMDGVGAVKVMLTVSDGGELVVEKDRESENTVTTETDSAGGSRSVSEISDREETIYVKTEEETYPYVQKEKVPTVEGVVVVAEGGGNPNVAVNISESVKALLPVEAHRIKVVKMCSKEE